MSLDFRAGQVRTNKLITSGSTGTNASLLIYPFSAASNLSGGINTAKFPITGIGSDIFIFFSGSGGSTFNTSGSYGLVGFMGDVITSGSILKFKQLVPFGVGGTDLPQRMKDAGFYPNLTWPFVMDDGQYLGGWDSNNQLMVNLIAASETTNSLRTVNVGNDKGSDEVNIFQSRSLTLNFSNGVTNKVTFLEGSPTQGATLLVGLKSGSYDSFGTSFSIQTIDAPTTGVNYAGYPMYWVGGKGTGQGSGSFLEVQLSYPDPANPTTSAAHNRRPIARFLGENLFQLFGTASAARPIASLSRTGSFFYANDTGKLFFQYNSTSWLDLTSLTGSGGTGDSFWYSDIAGTIKHSGSFQVTGSGIVSGNLTVLGNVSLLGDTTLGDNLAGDKVAFGSRINSDILPAVGGFKLGSSAIDWASIFVQTIEMRALSQSLCMVLPLANGGKTSITRGMACYISGANSVDISAADADYRARVSVICLDTLVVTGSTGRFALASNGVVPLTASLQHGSRSWQAGDTIWLNDSNAGSYTITEPSGSGTFSIEMGVVLDPGNGTTTDAWAILQKNSRISH